MPSPDLDIEKIRGLKPPFFKSLYHYASEFYKKAPWTTCRSHHVTKITAFGDSRVFQLVGASGIDFGLIVWKSFRDFERMLLPGCSQIEATLKGQPCGALFQKADQCEPAQLSMIRRRKLETPSPEVYPNFILYGRPPPFNSFDLKMLEAAFALLPKLYLEQLERDSPYGFKELTVAEQYESGIGHPQSVTITYPGGNIDLERQRLGGLPSHVQMYAPIPGNLSIGEGIEYYRSKVGKRFIPSRERLQARKAGPIQKCLKLHGVNISGCLSTADLLEAADKARAEGQNRLLDYEDQAVIYGLANALWKVEKVELTLEAIEAGNKLLQANQSDQMAVRYFLLDLYLELDQLEEALQLMDQYPDEWSVEWFWTAALLWYRKKGAQSAKAKSALQQAVKQNPHVVQFLSGEKALPPNQQRGYTITISKTGVMGDENEAIKYLDNHKRHWYQSKGATAWVKEQGTVYRSKLNHEKRSMERDVAAGFPVNPIQAELNIPNTILTCHNCRKGASRADGIVLKRCSGCRIVSYCSRECQKLDWLQHKMECKKNAGPSTAK